MTIEYTQTIKLAADLGIKVADYINGAGVLDMTHLHEEVMAAYHEAHLPLLEMAEEAHMETAAHFDAMTDEEIKAAI